MKRIFFTLLYVVVATAYSFACTNIIVGKKASKDGSVFVSYNADSYGAYMELDHYPASLNSKGTMRQVYDWDTNKHLGAIPEAGETYNVVGNINEWQVAIGETTYGGREEMVDTTGLIDYGSLIYMALQRSKTAREAVKVMTSLAETYGYCSEGETFSICDPNEAWIMEMQGKGAGSKGVVWVALRIPDDCICAHANQSRIRQFNMKDKENVMFSKDVVKFAREKGWFTGKDADFSWADAYCPADFGARRFCEARVWSVYNRFVEGGFKEYLPWAMGNDKDAKPMPLWVKPKKLLTVHDVETAMRDHYEGTPMALDNPEDPGQGLWTAPYRPTPLQFEVDSVKYFNERPISTQQTAFSFVAQLRSWLPRQIGGILWFGNDDSNMVSYVPMYCCITQIPECFSCSTILNAEGKPEADATHFSMKSSYWVCNWVSNMVYPRYEMMFPDLMALRDSLDNRYFRQQEGIEQEALAIMKEKGEAECVMFLNSYSVREAQQMHEAWKNLAFHLIVKYNDMAVKPEANGEFLLTKDGLGASVKRPGYSKNARHAVAKYRNGWYKLPE